MSFFNNFYNFTFSWWHQSYLIICHYTYFQFFYTLSNRLVPKGRILVSPPNKIHKIMLKNCHFLIIFIILHSRGGTTGIPLYLITNIFIFFHTLSNRLVAKGRILVSSAKKKPKIMLKNCHFLIICIILHIRGGASRIPLYVITHIFIFLIYTK